MRRGERGRASAAAEAGTAKPMPPGSAHQRGSYARHSPLLLCAGPTPSTPPQASLPAAPRLPSPARTLSAGGRRSLLFEAMPPGSTPSESFPFFRCPLGNNCTSSAVGLAFLSSVRTGEEYTACFKVCAAGAPGWGGGGWLGVRGRQPVKAAGAGPDAGHGGVGGAARGCGLHSLHGTCATPLEPCVGRPVLLQQRGRG